MKIDLQDVTFLLPIRLDSIARLENLIASVEYIYRYFDTNIMITEAASYNNGLIQKTLKNRIDYTFTNDNDPVFYKTKYLNSMTKRVTTPLLAIWDVDVVVDKRQIIDAVTQLRDQNADIAYPYDGTFIDTTDIFKKLFFLKKNVRILHKYKDKMNSLYGKEHIGGAIFVNAEKYKSAGGESERFYGWGPEDFDRHERWIKMEYVIYRAPGPMYHLSHPRDMNGQFRSRSQMNSTGNELKKTKSSTKEEIIKNNTWYD